MPIFLKGKGNWVKHCEECGKPFIKTARVQKRCEKCKGKKVTQKNTFTKDLNSSTHK